MTALVRVVLVALLVALASPAFAQLSDEAASDALSAVELRVGTISNVQGDPRLPLFGAGLRLRPWAGGTTAGRISITAIGDFRHLGHEEIFDVPLQSRARLGRWAFALGGALGVDVLETSRFVLDVRGGVALLMERTSFEIDSANGFVVDDDPWEGVCGFSGFQDRCHTDYSATGTVSIGARAAIKKNGSVYAGADYTRLVSGQDVFVAVLGVRSR